MPSKYLITAVLATALAVLLPTQEADAARKVRIQQGPDAEISFDGLHRVDRTVVDEAWAKPDLDLTRYRKAMIDPVGVSYREVEPARGSFARRRASEFPLTERQKKKFEKVLRDTFIRELDKVERFELVTRPDAETMVIEIAVIDVVSNVPPPEAGRVDIYLTEVGSATLVLQIRDALTNEILLRAVDRREAESSWLIEANSVSTWSEVRQTASQWARLLRKRLNEVGEFVAE